MERFLVVLGDHPELGSPKGEPLVRFLRCYLGDGVQALTPAEILAGPRIEADLVFVALPTSFGEAHLRLLKCRRFVLFDYYDEPEPEWGQSDQPLLRSLTDRYLKTHVLDGLEFGLRMGTLPVDYTPALRKEFERLSSSRLLRRMGSWVGREDRPWDITLLGSVTHLVKAAADGSRYRYHQRVEWMREVASRNDWRFWGGLFELPYFGKEKLEADCGSIDGLLWQGERLGFSDLFRKMSRTKISLAPLGHARWTFRHLESVYAGCQVISTDLSGVRTLIPLPAQCFEMVLDHTPLAPVVERILNDWPGDDSRREAAVAHFEQYLYRGRYDRRIKLPREVFLSQLD